MPVYIKALLTQDMQLKIDRWVDMETQTASDTGIDYWEAKEVCNARGLQSLLLSTKTFQQRRKTTIIPH